MKTTDVLRCAGAAIAIFLVASWVPFFRPLISLLTSLLFLYFASKSGRLQGILIVAFSLLIISAIAGLLARTDIIFLFVESGLIGLVLAELFRHELSFGHTMLWGTIALLAFEVLVLYLFSPSGDASPLELFLETGRARIKAFFAIFEKTESAALNDQQAQIMIKIFEQIYPALLVMGTAFVIWINIVFSKIFFLRIGLKYPDFGALDQWFAPLSMVWITIAAGFASFFAAGSIKFLAINLIVIFAAIYTWQGLMIMMCFFNKYRISIWLVSGICLLIFFQGYLLLVLTLAGLFDQWIDFRKLRQPAVKNPEDDFE